MVTREESRIRPLTGELQGPYTIEFKPAEVAVLDEMLGTHGDSREEVVFKAISLLYTIFKENPDAKAVFIQKGGKRVVIPLE